MQNENFFNQTKLDWTDRNLSVIKDCLEQNERAVAAHTNLADYPLLDTPLLQTVCGNLRWAMLKKILANAADNNLFDGITAHWIKFQGAPILELRGKYTSLTPCHVLGRDETPQESQNGYRKNNRAKNQVCMELFKEFEAPESENELFHILLIHGGRNDSFAFLRAYIGDSYNPVLSNNIMLMPSLVTTLDAEPDSKPVVTLKQNADQPERETIAQLPADRIQNEHSHS